MIDELQQKWAPLNDPIFQSTPTSFHDQANYHYTSLGQPAISKGMFWDIYKALLALFQRSPPDMVLEQDFNLANLGADQVMDLLPGLQQLQVSDEVVGDGVVSQVNYDEADFTDSDSHYEADFTDDET